MKDEQIRALIQETVKNTMYDPEFLHKLGGTIMEKIALQKQNQTGWEVEIHDEDMSQEPNAFKIHIEADDHPVHPRGVTVLYREESDSSKFVPHTPREDVKSAILHKVEKLEGGKTYWATLLRISNGSEPEKTDGE